MQPPRPPSPAAVCGGTFRCGAGKVHTWLPSIYDGRYHVKAWHNELMPVNRETTVRKNVAMPNELWERVRSWRFQNEVNTESEPIRRLVEAGLEALSAKPKGRGR